MMPPNGPGPSSNRSGGNLNLRAGPDQWDPPAQAAERPNHRGSVGEQILLIVADPGHVAVGPEEHGGHVQFVADVDEVDPIRPPRHREPAGLVQQESAPAVHQRVQASALQSRIPQPSAEELVPFLEVVPDPDRGDLLGQVAVPSAKSISSATSRRTACGPGSVDRSSICARVLLSTSAATGCRSVW